MSEFSDSDNDSLQIVSSKLSESARIALAVVLMLWVVYVFQYQSEEDLGEWGVYPRKIWGLPGIITAPFIHGSLEHLLSNTPPLFILTLITFYFYEKVATRALLMIYFLTGIAVWLMARPVYHIGASGVVYGLVAFIFWNGIFRQSVQSIVLGLLILLLYSGMFMGVLPDQEGVSWESHLLGSLMGIYTAFWFKDELEENEVEDRNQALDDETEKQYFLPRDTFTLTKQEREEAARRAAESAASPPPPPAPPPQNPGEWYSDWTI